MTIEQMSSKSIYDIVMDDDFWLQGTWAKLRYLPWRFFYIDYDTLSQDTSDMQKLTDEWKKVHDFYMLKRGEIERRIEYYKILIIQQDNPIPPNTLKFMLVEIHHLYHFIQLNYCAYLRLSIKLDTTSTKTCDHFLPLLQLVFKINQLANHDKFCFPGFSPKKKKRCYWIHPDNMMEVVLFLSTKSSMVPGTMTHETQYEVGTPKEHISDAFVPVRFNTIYFDSPLLTTYQARCLAQHHPVPISRMRWTEHNAMFEQKFYRKGNMQEEWVQTRLWLKSRHLFPWMDGQFSFNTLFSKEDCEYKHHGSIVMDEKQIEKIKETCLLLENEIHQQEKIPVMKIEQNRLDFILNNTTASLDYDITMHHVLTQETQLFPYCVLQMSFGDAAEENEWVQFLAQYDMFKAVDHFSIYLHSVGIFTLHEKTDDIRCYSSRGKLIEDEPKQTIKLVNRKSIDSITTTATDVSFGSECSNGTQATVVTQTSYKKPKRHGSYCSFDHPTSSNSDPKNCKSCLAKLNKPPVQLEGLYSPILKRPRPSDQEITTFGAFLLKTFLPRRFKSLEKEALMSPTYRQYRTFSSQNLEELGKVSNAQTSTHAISRATVLTVCIIVSTSLFYVLISADI